jgi:hypothetical protein
MGGSSDGVSGDSAAGKASLSTPPACAPAEAAAPEPAGEAAALPLPAGAVVPPHAASAKPPMATRLALRNARRVCPSPTAGAKRRRRVASEEARREFR